MEAITKSLYKATPMSSSKSDTDSDGSHKKHAFCGSPVIVCPVVSYADLTPILVGYQWDMNSILAPAKLMRIISGSSLSYILPPILGQSHAGLRPKFAGYRKESLI